jgi:enoyl-CoA hydratase/carnithine racemase
VFVKKAVIFLADLVNWTKEIYRIYRSRQRHTSIAGRSQVNHVDRIVIIEHKHVLEVRLNRAEKRNAADMELLQQLALAYGRLEADPQMRVGLVTAEGDHLTAGLDLADVGQHMGADGLSYVPEGGLDPWGIHTAQVSKPVVIAAKGICYTLGIELILAADIAVAAHGTRFAQLEVQRGILPFGGATLRFAERCGWGNAMRWILTGETFDDAEALRIGLVQETCSPDDVDTRALALAQSIAQAAPLAVAATLANARLARAAGHAEASARLQPELMRLMASNDAKKGFVAFASRQQAIFSGD